MAATETVIIANGESLSAALDCRAYANAGMSPVRIVMPAAWTAAVLTFQTSIDGVTYTNLYDEAIEVQCASAAASRSIAIAPRLLVGVNYLRIRSGTAGTPVNQGGARSLTVIFANVESR